MCVCVCVSYICVFAERVRSTHEPVGTDPPPKSPNATRCARAFAQVRDAVGWEGEIVWDSSKPDGTPRKLLDVSKLTGGWRALEHARGCARCL